MIDPENSKTESQGVLVYRKDSVVNKQARQMMEDLDGVGDIILSFGEWVKCGASEEIGKVVEWRVRRNLYLTSAGDQQILKGLSAALKLAQDNLGSLEVICRLDAPMLSQLWLWSNKYISVSSLRKVNFPKLKDIQVQTCPINNIQVLSELNAKQLEKVDHTAEITNGSMTKNWMAKLETKNRKCKPFEDKKSPSH